MAAWELGIGRFGPVTLPATQVVMLRNSGQRAEQSIRHSVPPAWLKVMGLRFASLFLARYSFPSAFPRATSRDAAQSLE